MLFYSIDNLQLPDALETATAIVSNCQGFLTNDAQLQRVTELRALLVGELEIRSPSF